MRWWLNKDHKSFAVDNAVVRGLDFSALDADIWFIQWTDGRGEIERQDVAADENLNGLRENFIDVMPYAPLFQQFLLLTPDLLIDQAKKVQIELINTIFDSKRQMPFHYPVAAGDYWWDASDGSMAAATVPSIQNLNAKVNDAVSYINAILNHLNSVCSLINTGVSAPGDSLIDQINAYIVGPNNNAIFANNVNISDVSDALVAYINSTIVGAINAGLVKTTVATVPGDTPTSVIAAPGVTSPIVASTIDYVYNPYTSTDVGGDFATFSTLGLGNLAPVASTNVQWIPIGATTPVNVTPAEQQAILSGIAARTNQLNLVRNSKNAAVNALAVVASVIAYDVTTGWPATPLPPGFELWKPMSSGGNRSEVAFVGSGTAPVSGGIPEAPNDGVTYGRQNMMWNPALAKTADVLDGGNF